MCAEQKDSDDLLCANISKIHVGLYCIYDPTRFSERTGRDFGLRTEIKFGLLISLLD